jgi:hypothetical protein
VAGNLLNDSIPSTIGQLTALISLSVDRLFNYTASNVCVEA